MEKDKLIDEIMREAEKEGEPLTREEATEIAEMELKAKGLKRYEKGSAPRKKADKMRKVDTEKAHILGCIKNLLEGMRAEIASVKTETEIAFTYNGNSYTVKLTKHRPKK